MSPPACPPTYRLLYFNSAGRAEMIRLAFAIGDIKFEDVRLSYDEWNAVKSSDHAPPMKQLPALEINGVLYNQSLAILRYVGQITGLYPSCPVQGLRVNELIDGFGSFIDSVVNAWFESDPERKKVSQQRIVDSLPNTLALLEKLVASNRGPWSVGCSLTIADLVIMSALGILSPDHPAKIPFPADLEAQFPSLFAVRKAVMQHARVVAYYAAKAQKEDPPKLKLTYFDVKGSAEPVRLALHLAGIDFEDNRVRMADWPALKPSVPSGQLPFLTVNGKDISQSKAIIRYVGGLTKTMPCDWIEAAKVESILGFMGDIDAAVTPSYYMQGDAQLAARKVLAEETLPPMYTKLEAMINEHGYLYGNSITMADLKLSVMHSTIRSGRLTGIPTTLLDAYPKITALAQRVADLPAIKAYEAKLRTTRPTLKLIYFNLHGRAGASRWALAQGGYPFEDVRFEREAWPALKATMPYGQVPVLEINGEPLAQSSAILHYVSKLTGLYPQCSIAEALALEVEGICDDISNCMTPSMRERDTEKKMAMRAVLRETDLPKWYKLLTSKLAGNQFFVDGRLSFADLAVATHFQMLDSGFIDGISLEWAESVAPALVAHYRRVIGQPKIAAWIQKEKDAAAAPKQ